MCNRPRRVGDRDPAGHPGNELREENPYGVPPDPDILGVRARPLIPPERSEASAGDEDLLGGPHDAICRGRCDFLFAFCYGFLHFI